MIMSTTLVSKVLAVVDCAVAAVVVGVGSGAGAGAPLVGILPANTGTDTSPVRAIANTSRFIF